MPKARYEALPAHDELNEEPEEDGESEQVLINSLSGTSTGLPYATPRRPYQHQRRDRSAFKIDIPHLDAKLKQWVNTLNIKFASPRRA